MLDDRFYMRRPQFRSYQSATVGLLIVNVAAFVLQSLVYGYPLRLVPDDCFALSTQGLRHGYLWQLLTYQFMHAGLIHLLFNCWAIFVFGREVESTLGRSRFLTLYFSSGVVGGLLQALAGAWFPDRFGGPTVGASAGAFGLVAAFAVLYPERPLMLLLFFVIPVSMRAKFLLLFSALLAVFGLAIPVDNIAHAAHLGGMLTGIAFVRYAIHRQWQWHWPRRRRDAPARRLIKVYSPGSMPWAQRKSAVAEDLPPDEFLAREVDPILDKISAQGIQSLTERERRILETARQKIVRG